MYYYYSDVFFMILYITTTGYLYQWMFSNDLNFILQVCDKTIKHLFVLFIPYLTFTYINVC